MNVAPKTAERILYVAMGFFALLPLVLLFVLKKNPRMDTTVAPASTISAVPVQGAMAVPDISHLNSPEQNISDDLVLLQEVLRSYKKAKGQFPTGTNAAIVVLLMSKDSGAPWIPAGHRALSAEGQLVDRWGTALQFVNMPDGGMTIRTAGPDTQYGTQDDFRVVVAP